jgi:putative peptidoglycan lipid II flippase
LDRTLRTVLFLTLPAAVGLYVLRVPLIQILLERGNFTAESTAAVAYALQFFALGLVAHALVEIIVRVFYALHDTLTPVIIGIGAMLLNILFSLWWIGWLGYGGLALANSVATILEMLVLLALLRRRLGALPMRSLLVSAVRSTLAAVVMGLAVWGWLSWLTDQPLWIMGLPTGWTAALGGLLIALITYAGVSFALGAEELRSLVSPLLRRLINR